MTRHFAIGSLAALVALVAGCKSPRAIGHFAPDAFYHARDHYRVRYLAPERRQLLPGSWVLDNFEHEDGRPTIPREEPTYWTDYFVEHPRVGARAVRAERFDLRFTHVAGDGVIWARSVPSSRASYDARVDLILRDAIGAMADEGVRGLDLVGYPVAQGDEASLEVRGHGRASVDGLPAYWASFDVTNQRSGVVDRYTVVLLRPPGGTWRAHRWTFPMLLVLGYASPPTRYAALRPTFESFVGRIDLADPS